MRDRIQAARAMLGRGHRASVVGRVGAACITALAVLTFAPTAGACVLQKRVVVLHFTAAQRPVLDHWRDAIAHGQPLIWHIDRAHAEQHRAESLRGHAPAGPGKDLDEVPPAVAREGGAGADVEAIDLHANRSQGASMGAQLSPFCDGQSFRIPLKPGPKPRLGVTGPSGVSVNTAITSAGAAGGTGTVQLAAATYPSEVVTARPASPVVVTGPGAVLDGWWINGARDVTFRAVRIVGAQFKIARAARITVAGSDVSGGCIAVRDASTDIRITGSRLHDCFTGVAGPGRPRSTDASSGVTIDGNVIEDMSSDGIQFGDWSHVRITGNVVRRVRDLVGSTHNDDVQLTGGSVDVLIEGNVLSGRSGTESSSAVFAQPRREAGDVRGIDGLTVRGNAVGRTGAVAFQSQGATGAVFEENTACQGALGGLWLRDALGLVAPADSVVRWNVLGSFRLLGGATAALAAGNTVCATRTTRGT